MPVEERVNLVIELITKPIATVDDAVADDPTEVEQTWTDELELPEAAAE